MIRAAIIGLGTWGQNLVRNVHGSSPHIQFTAAQLAHADHHHVLCLARLCARWYTVFGTQLMILILQVRTNRKFSKT